MERKYLNNVVQFLCGPTFTAWHDLIQDMFKVLSLTVCLIAGTFQMTFAQRIHPHELKSTATAVKYSVYGTAIPIVVGGTIFFASIASNAEEPDPFLAGIMIGSLGAVGGPGLGHAYAERWGRFALGGAIRTVGAFFLASGIMGLLWGDDPSGMGHWGESSEGYSGDERPLAVLLLMGGGAIYLWSTIHDFKSLDTSVEQYNQKHKDVTISISPTYYACKNALGIVVSVQF